MIRLFVAVDLPLDVRERLHQMGGGVPGARWLDVEKLHLTVRFIGDVPEDQARDSIAELAEIDFPAFDLTLDSVGCFGEGRKTRILWAGIQPSPELLALKSKLDVALTRAGVDADRHHKFSPHITLARLRHPPPDRVIQWLQSCAGFYAGPVTVDHFTLYSSDGHTYRVEQAFGLAQPG
ncbi:MAG: RNA 2',3'-cyclic phosphodiesterase [Alphaproteobacteria bacterium]|jgi:RNA 2',3'-cyclic 3'-phosphodiesterase|nr:RNA 2',3'-cyclic phosphodiesterase [Alphaproteobacteria bacterium]MBT4016556.1 RNA 2',3'-cyclic phosphodiesterase [Alphaproteobacteria bacterium]MBT4967159.1 RNA 2',3'-cyclic phosphodiesterase [Alphaproteobacteria bacterium]MBT5158526.1 RNA 2',3'-cyclic phosphodiesterase [Alphaproteobacteria bacterium]MBT5919733.1 RNA 2',3'-cyclic phosphodiesterase [Alphaproteobacteria bacterium]